MVSRDEENVHHRTSGNGAYDRSRQCRRHCALPSSDRRRDNDGRASRVTVIDAGFKIAEVYGGEADVIMMPSTAGVFYGRYHYNSHKAKLKNYGPVHRELFKDAEGLMCWRNARFKLCIFSQR
jgi:hypothetical protein